MTKTEIRKLKVGSKYTYDHPLWCYKETRIVKFIARDGKRKPVLVFYGVSYDKRNNYDSLLSPRYKLVEP